MEVPVKVSVPACSSSRGRFSTLLHRLLQKCLRDRRGPLREAVCLCQPRVPLSGWKRGYRRTSPGFGQNFVGLRCRSHRSRRCLRDNNVNKYSHPVEGTTNRNFSTCTGRKCIPQLLHKNDEQLQEYGWLLFTNVDAGNLRQALESDILK